MSTTGYYAHSPKVPLFCWAIRAPTCYVVPWAVTIQHAKRLRLLTNIPRYTRVRIDRVLCIAMWPKYSNKGASRHFSFRFVVQYTIRLNESFV